MKSAAIEQASFYSVDQVAKMLNIPRTKVRIMSSDLELVSYFDCRQMCIPTWQFKNGQLIRGVSGMLQIMGSNGKKANDQLTFILPGDGCVSVASYLRQGELEAAQELLIFLIETSK